MAGYSGCDTDKTSDDMYFDSRRQVEMGSIIRSQRSRIY